MSKKKVRIAITGAAGQIGYALLPRIASGQMFGSDTEIEFHLLELERALPALNGVAMEIEDCAFPLVKKILCTANSKEALDGVNWACLMGSFPRKEGMERVDLLHVNGEIFAPLGKEMNEVVADDMRCLVVGNPCNTNALIAMNNAKDIPRDRFFAMTMLDENRARTQLAQKASVGVSEVTNMTIWGNHSSTQWPDFYHARIQGKPALEVIGDESWLQQAFVERVQQRGAVIIQARGASSAASAASAVVDTIHHLTHDTPKGESFSVAKCSEGEYGVDEGLIFSYPCQTVRGRLQVVMGREQGSFGFEKFEITHRELQGERDSVRSAGLI